MTLFDYLVKTDRTEAEIASVIGCSQGTVNKLKLGKAKPSLDLMRRIVYATGGDVTPNDFAGIIPDQNKDEAQ